MAFPGTQSLPLQFQGGLNSKIAEFSLPQPNLQAANNAVYNKLGQIDKRTGFTAIGTDVIDDNTNIMSGQAITTFNNELIVMDGANIYSYDQANDGWINKGSLFATINDQVRVINTKIATQSNPDCTTVNGIQLYVWEDNRPVPSFQGAGIRYSVLDTNTNNQLVSDQFVYPLGRSCKVIGVGNTFNLFYSAATSILCQNVISSSNPELLPTFTQFANDGYSPNNTNFIYDAMSISGDAVVVYSANAGIKLGYPANEVLLSGTWATCLALCATTPSLWLAYTDAVKGGTWVYNITSSSLYQLDTLSSNNITIIEDTVSGNLNVTYELPPDTVKGFNYIKNASVSATGVITTNFTQRKVGLASKAFKVNNNIFVNTIGVTNLQSTYFTLCLTSFTSFNCTAVAKHAPSNGGNYRNNGLLSQSDAIGTASGSAFIFAGQRKGPFTSYQNSQTVNLGVAGYSVQFSPPNAFNNVAANNNLHLVGGVKKIYDGVSVVEDNFHFFPEDATDGNSCYVKLLPGGNLTYNSLAIPNSYQYLVVYEWTDNYGQVQRSGPGVAVTVIVGEAGLGGFLTIPTLTITDKTNARSPIAISVYRTQDSLPIFYKITDDNQPLVNDTSVDYVTMFDDLSDIDIGANENLYTGSQLGNSGPPACSLISLYQDRLFINTTEDPNVLWYSQNKFEQDQYNTLPLDWNTSFTEGVDSRLSTATGITAIGLMDQSLVIFKETSIFLLQGDGPNALFTTGQFNDAVLLVSDTGCSNANSLVFITQTPNSPGGLLFKSDKGIYLLGRDTSITYIGAAVEKYNNLTITSANLLAKSNQVVFTTLEGTCLVYNYYFNAWTTWSTLPAIDAAVWQNQLVILTPNGQVIVQDITNTIYQDTISSEAVYPVSLSITTPWINVGAMQGYMCVYNCVILGTLQGSHILNVQVAYDYNASIISNVDINSNVATNRWGSLPIWGSTGPWGNGTLFANYQFQVNFTSPHFRCESVQLTISDINPDATAGFSLNGLVFEVLALPGNTRLPTSNVAGSQ